MKDDDYKDLVDYLECISEGILEYIHKMETDSAKVSKLLKILAELEATIWYAKTLEKKDISVVDLDQMISIANLGVEKSG